LNGRKLFKQTNILKKTMKIHYKIAAAALMLGFAVQANAQNFGSTMAHASVGVTIVEPLAITKTADMNFGSIALNGQYADVFLNANGTLFSPYDATLIQSSGATAASFTVTGGDLAYSISLPIATVYLENETGQTIQILNFVDSKGSVSQISSGSDTFTVGAALRLEAMQPAGIYIGSFDVFVNYQ
jgi:hypothetical protein